MTGVEAEADLHCSVLLADDDRSFCSSLADVLEAARHRVDIVHSGRDVLGACATKRSYDLLLLDINLPDLSGLELIPQVEQMLPELEILVVTGHASMHNAIQAVSRSTIGYLVKPLDLDQLLAIHEKIAQRKRIRAENERLVVSLYQAKRQLEDKNAELERYAYTASHDLRSPLFTIKGFLGSLARSLEAGDLERMQADMTHIARATDKMAQLLDGLLELSRIGRLIHSPEPVSLAALAGEAVARVVRPPGERPVDVRIAGDMPAVRGDRLRLLTVFHSLADNAIKFVSSAPKPRVEFDARRDEGEVVCFVRDNGIGIEERYLGKIFELFEQLGQDHEGTGLGLALVKRIVVAHGGRIWVESEGLGKGATFFFTLPL